MGPSGGSSVPPRIGAEELIMGETGGAAVGSMVAEAVGSPTWLTTIPATATDATASTASPASVDLFR
jgi:hypothetical protein